VGPPARGDPGLDPDAGRRRMSELDPRAELAELSHALGALVRRRAALGRRSTPRPPRPTVAAPAAPAAPAPRAPTPAAAPSTPAAPASRRSPARAAEPRRSAAQAAVERAAGEVAARAAACPDLETLRAEVAGCTACGLCRTRTQTVFADGAGTAGVMFVGEAPGFHEDQQGVPFVGRAGELLSDIVTKGMGLAREQVYIANVLKCRPPDNRDPTEHEKRLCTPFLDRQIELVDPRVIVPLGRHAACHVLGVRASMAALRGRVHDLGGRKVVPTFHPAYLLRSPGQKKECWADIRLAMDLLGLEPPPRDAVRPPGR